MHHQQQHEVAGNRNFDANANSIFINTTNSQSVFGSRLLNSDVILTPGVILKAAYSRPICDRCHANHSNTTYQARENSDYSYSLQNQLESAVHTANQNNRMTGFKIQVCLYHTFVSFAVGSIVVFCFCLFLVCGD